MTLQADSAMSAEDFFSTELFHAIRSKSFRDKKVSALKRWPARPTGANWPNRAAKASRDPHCNGIARAASYIGEALDS